MFRVRNNKDFREGYELLNLLNRFAGQFDSPEKARENADNLKRELRTYAHRNTAVDVGMGFMCERRIVKDDGMDGYIELVSLPEVIDTIDGEDGANEFFKTFLEIQYRPTYYDCTGQAFTSWYKLFKRNGQFWAYHSVCFDV